MLAERVCLIKSSKSKRLNSSLAFIKLVVLMQLRKFENNCSIKLKAWIRQRATKSCAKKIIHSTTPWALDTPDGAILNLIITLRARWSFNGAFKMLITGRKLQQRSAWTHYSRRRWKLDRKQPQQPLRSNKCFCGVALNEINLQFRNELCVCVIKLHLHNKVNMMTTENGWINARPRKIALIKQPHVMALFDAINCWICMRLVMNLRWPGAGLLRQHIWIADPLSSWLPILTFPSDRNQVNWGAKPVREKSNANWQLIYELHSISVKLL